MACGPCRQKGRKPNRLMDNSLLRPLESTIINGIKHSFTAEIVVKSGWKLGVIWLVDKKAASKTGLLAAFTWSIGRSNRQWHPRIPGLFHLLELTKGPLLPCSCGHFREAALSSG